MSAVVRAARVAGQVGLGAALLWTGTLHLTSARRAFRAQVPSWFPADADRVVLASGGAELALGGALLVAWPQPARALVGAATAGFFVAIFPGNVAQLVERREAFGLDSDAKRAARLLFQPVLVAWALAATDAPRVYRATRAVED